VLASRVPEPSGEETPEGSEPGA